MFKTFVLFFYLSLAGAIEPSFGANKENSCGGVTKLGARVINESTLKGAPIDRDMSIFNQYPSGSQNNPYLNGGLLLEFFGPMKNTFNEWLKWLESDSSEGKPKGPGLYRGPHGYIVGKTMEFPIDGGLTQFAIDPQRKVLVPLMEFLLETIKTLKGSSLEAQAARKRFFEKLDVQLYGVYGILRPSKSDAESADGANIRWIKGDGAFLASLNEGVRIKVTTDWIRLSTPEQREAITSPLVDLERVAQVIEQNEKTTLIRVKLGKGAEPRSRNEEIIQKMFFITHWQMVQKAYRDSGLFEDNMKTAFYLLDNFIQSTKEVEAPQELYLMYDSRAWESMRYRMHLAHQYVSLHMTGAGYQPFRYQTISDVFYPHYPIYGMVVEKHGENSFEYKRLFFNDNPDPLTTLSPLDGLRRLQGAFYGGVTEQLPTNASIEAISKTDSHTTYYRRLGFKTVETTYNPEWQSQMVTLKHKREELLRRLQ